MKTKTNSTISGAFLNETGVFTKESANKVVYPLVQTILGTAITVGMLHAANAIVSHLQEKNVKAKSGEYYQKMLKSHPQLQKMDPKTVAKYWASLYHFAPTMAQDPLAAGAYITQSIKMLGHEEFGGPHVDSINTLTTIEKGLGADPKPSRLRMGIDQMQTVAINDLVERNISGIHGELDKRFGEEEVK